MTPEYWYPIPSDTRAYDRVDTLAINRPQGSEKSLVASVTRVINDPTFPSETSQEPILIFLDRLAEDPEMAALTQLPVEEGLTEMVYLAWYRRTFPTVE